jgi:hypothetical protein
MTRRGLGGLGKISCKVRVHHVHPVAEQDQAKTREVTVVKEAPGCETESPFGPRDEEL